MNRAEFRLDCAEEFVAYGGGGPLETACDGRRVVGAARGQPATVGVRAHECRLVSAPIEPLRLPPFAVVALRAGRRRPAVSLHDAIVERRRSPREADVGPAPRDAEREGAAAGTREREFQSGTERERRCRVDSDGGVGLEPERWRCLGRRQRHAARCEPRLRARRARLGSVVREGEIDRPRLEAAGIDVGDVHDVGGVAREHPPKCSEVCTFRVAPRVVREGLGDHVVEQTNLPGPPQGLAARGETIERGAPTVPFPERRVERVEVGDVGAFGVEVGGRIEPVARVERERHEAARRCTADRRCEIERVEWADGEGRRRLGCSGSLRRPRVRPRVRCDRRSDRREHEYERESAGDRRPRRSEVGPPRRDRAHRKTTTHERASAVQKPST